MMEEVVEGVVAEEGEGRVEEMVRKVEFQVVCTVTDSRVEGGAAVCFVSWERGRRLDRGVVEEEGELIGPS